MLSIDPNRALYRFKNAQYELARRAPDGYLLSHVDTRPVDDSYPRAEIFFGSHFDQNPDTEDRIEIWNSRPLPGEGELIHQEIFVQRKESTGWNPFKKTPVLHCYHVTMKTGGAVAALALVTIDLGTGQPIRQEEGEQAARTIRKKGLGEHSRQHDHESMRGYVPQPVPEHEDPAWKAAAREEVTRMAEALTGDSPALVRMHGDAVVVGGVRLPKRSSQ